MYNSYSVIKLMFTLHFFPYHNFGRMLRIVLSRILAEMGRDAENKQRRQGDK